MPHTDVSYHTTVLPSADEAESLRGYLTEHGFFAILEGKKVLTCTVENAEDYAMIQILKTTWRRFWDNSDSGLFGLPMFIKES